MVTDAPSCPWCGESNLTGRLAQIQPADAGQWLCNTCSKTFSDRQHHTRAQGDGDDGQDDTDVPDTTLQKPTVTEEDMRDVGREAFGLAYPGDPPKPKRKPLPITLTAQIAEQIRARHPSR